MKKIFYISCCLLLISCYDDFDNTTEEIIEETPSTLVFTGLDGQVLNVPDLNAANYTLKVNDDIYPLDSDRFFLELNRVRKMNQSLELYKDGQLAAIAGGFLIENDVNYVSFNIMNDIFAEQIQAGSPRELDWADNIQFQLGANVSDVTGNSLTGSAEMQLSAYNTTDDLDHLPRLYMNSNGAHLLDDIELAFHINSMDDNGNKVLFDPSQSAIKVLNEKPDFDLYKWTAHAYHKLNADSSGAYSFDGSGFYVYAHAVPADIIESRIDLDNTPVSFAKLNLNASSIHSTANGKWMAIAEEGQSLEIELENPCADILQSWSSNADALTATSGLSLNNTFASMELNYEAIDCAGDNVTYPGLEVSYNNELNAFWVFRDNPVNRIIINCDESAELSSIDVETYEQGPFIEWTDAFNDELRTMSQCPDDGEGFAFVTINGISKKYAHFNVENADGVTKMASMDGQFRFKFNGDTAGSYIEQDVNIFINDPQFGPQGFAISCENSSLGCGIEYMNVTHYEEDGWLRVSMRGEIWAQTLTPPIADYYPIEAVFLTEIK